MPGSAGRKAVQGALKKRDHTVAVSRFFTGIATQDPATIGGCGQRAGQFLFAWSARDSPDESHVRSAMIPPGEFGDALQLFWADNSFGRAIPTPYALVPFQVDTAEPAIDAVQLDVVCPALNDLASQFCDRDLTQTLAGPVRYLNERMPRFGQIRHHPIERPVSHEDLLLLILHRDKELSPGQWTVLMKDRQSLPLRAGQAIVSGRKLFQMTPQCRTDKRQSGFVGRDETLDLRGNRRCECVPRRLRGSILRFTDRQTGVGQRGQLVGRQCSKPDKKIHAWESPNANQAQLYPPWDPPAEPVEHLDEDQLVRQAIVEPDYDFVVLTVGGERALTSFQVCLRLLWRSVSGLGDETSS